MKIIFNICVAVSFVLCSTGAFIKVNGSVANNIERRKIIFKNLRFLKNSTEIDKTLGSEQELDSMIKILNSCNDISVIIIGHTSKEGNPKEAIKLSDGRAKSIRDLLITRGVPNFKFLKAYGVGSSRPMVIEPEPRSLEAKNMNSTELEELRKKNRRFEFEIVRECDKNINIPKESIR